MLFVFRHLTQQHGWDAIPKLQVTGVKDFDNLFRDALGELSNLSRYETFTELPNDVNDPKRRQQLEDERASVDYVIAIDFLEESSFRQQFLSGTVSTLSGTLVPAPYDWDYTITANVSSKRARVALVPASGHAHQLVRGVPGLRLSVLSARRQARGDLLRVAARPVQADRGREGPEVAQ